MPLSPKHSTPQDKRPEGENDPSDKPGPRREVVYTVIACIAVVLVTCFVAIYKNQFGANQSDVFNVTFLLVAISGIALVAQLAGFLLKTEGSLLLVLLRRIGLLVAWPLVVIGLTIAGMAGYMDAMAYGTDSLVWGAGCVLAAIGGFAIVANEAISQTWKKCAIVALALVAGLVSGLVVSEPLANGLKDRLEHQKEDVAILTL